MRLTLIAAVDRDGSIGSKDGVPWEYPDDVEQYRERIGDEPTIIGRRTFEQMTDPPGDPIVVTRQVDYEAPEATVANGVGEALAAVEALGDGASDGHPRGVDGTEPGGWVAGGEGAYRLFVPYATGAVVSELPERAGGESSFPYLGLGWSAVNRVAIDPFEVVEYVNETPEDTPETA